MAIRQTHHAANLSARRADHAARRIDGVDLDHALGQIDPDSSNLVHGLSFRMQIDNHQYWRLDAVGQKVGSPFVFTEWTPGRLRCCVIIHFNRSTAPMRFAAFVLKLEKGEIGNASIHNFWSIICKYTSSEGPAASLALQLTQRAETSHRTMHLGPPLRPLSFEKARGPLASTPTSA